MVNIKYYDNNGSVIVRVSYQGKVQRKTFKTKAKAQAFANTVAAEYERMNAKEVLGLPFHAGPVSGAIEKKKISEAIRHHVSQRGMKTDLENLSTDKSYFKRFYDFMFNIGKDYVHEITLADLEALQVSLVKEGQKGSSVNRFFASIKGFLNRCVDWNYIHESPGKKLKPLPVKKPEMITWTQEEVDAVMNQLPPWAKNYFHFLYSTGCRPKEASNLKYADVDFKNALVKLASAKGGAIRERKVPVSQDLLTLIESTKKNRIVQGASFVFINTKGNRVHPEVFSNEIKEVRRKLGLNDKLIPYGLRHTMCSTMADSNVGLAKIQAIAGHVRAETTMRYIHLKDDSLRDVINLVERKRSMRTN